MSPAGRHYFDFWKTLPSPWLESDKVLELLEVGFPNALGHSHPLVQA